MNAVIKLPVEPLPVERIPPHSVEAEQSVLGGLLLDNSVWPIASAVLRAGDFYTRDHGLIFAAIGALVNAGQPADVITAFGQLQSLGKADECGGLVYLNALAQSVPSAANMRRYAVRERAVLRKLVAASDEIASSARTTKGLSLAQILENAAVAVAGVATAPAVPHAMPRRLDFAALATNRAPARHWIRPQWLAAGPALLAGSGGAGKSSLVQHEATTGALGRRYFAPDDSEPYRSLVLNCEDTHDDLWLRQEAICEHERIDMADLHGRLYLESRFGCDNALMAPVNGQLTTTPLFKALREQVNDLRIDALWLDNAAHLFLGDHDNRTEVTQYVNAVNGLVVGRPLAVIHVAHVSRLPGSEFTGSVAWENAVRMRLFIGSKLPDQRVGDDEPESDVRYLAKRKSNHSARDYVKFTMRRGLLVPEGAPGHVGAVMQAIDQQKADSTAMAGLRALAAMGIRATDGKTSPDYLPSQIVAKGLAAGYTKHDLGKAMNRLMASGALIRAQVGQQANRSPKFGLCEAPK